MRLDLYLTKNVSSLLEKSLVFSDKDKQEVLNLPRSFWQKEIYLGNIKFKNNIVKPSINITFSEKLLVNCNWDKIKNNWKKFYQINLIPRSIILNFILVKNDYLVVNKPASISVHPAFPMDYNKPRETTLIEGVINKFPEISKVALTPQEKNRPGIVHRLDRETSGALLVVRTSKAKQFFQKKFKERSIKKTYFALVGGEFPYDKFEISSLIGKKAKNPIKMNVNNLKIRTENCYNELLQKNSLIRILNPKKSVTEGKKIISGSLEQIVRHNFEGLEILKAWKKYLKSEKNNKFTFLKLSPRTGRTHQIRVHLASVGYPITGDKLYGQDRNNLLPFHCLHAYRLEWDDIDGKRVSAQTDKVSLF